MNLMFFSILVGAPIVVSMGVLILGILMVFGFTVGETTYTLYENGLQQNIKTYILFKVLNRTKVRFILWETIRSYKSDIEVGKSMKEYEYLKLKLRKSPFKIWITDQIDRHGFVTFRDDFIDKVEEYNYNHSKNKNLESTTVVKASEPHSDEKARIENTPSFYGTLASKILTVFFVGLVVAIQYYANNIGLSPGSSFKLNVVLIPGTAYLIYRTFGRK